MNKKDGLNFKLEPKVQKVGRRKNPDGFCLIPTVIYKVLGKRVFCFSTKILKRYILKRIKTVEAWKIQPKP